MALKKDGNLFITTVTLDKTDYGKLVDIAVRNKEANKKLIHKKDKKDMDKVSQLLRYAMKKYVTESSEFSILERYTKKELRNYFSLPEVFLIATALKGTLYDVTTISPKIVLLSKITDLMDLDNFHLKYNVNKEVLTNKLQKLSEFQCYIVIKMSLDFWSTCGDYNDSEYINANLMKFFLITEE